METTTLGAAEALLVEVREKPQPEGSPEGMLPTFELWLEVCGRGGAALRQDTVMALTAIKAICQKVVDEVPGLGRAKAVHNESVSAMWSNGESVSIKVAENPIGQFNNSIVIEPDPDAMEEVKFCAEKMRFGNPLESSFTLYRLIGVVEPEKVERLKNSVSEAVIIDECLDGLEPNDSEECTRDEYGWSDLDWLRYISGTSLEPPPKTDTRGSFRQTTGLEQKVMHRSIESDEELAKANVSMHEKLAATAKNLGFDQAHKAVDLGSFAALETATKAGLSKAHVLALRLYATTRWASKINEPLHDGCSPERIHPYPALVSCLFEAFWKLRNFQAHVRAEATARTEQTAEMLRVQKAGDDDDEIRKAQQEFDKATAYLKELTMSECYRGIAAMTVADFKLRGGAEIGFTSVTTNKDVAKKAARLVHQNARRKRYLEDEREEELASMPAAESHAGLQRRQSMDVDEFAKAMAEGGAPAVAELKARRQSRELGGPLNPPEGEGEDDDEEMIYLPLAALPVNSVAAQDNSPKKTADLPARLFKIIMGNEETMPVDLSAFCVHSNENEWFYPPGIYLEHRREVNESVGSDEETGEELYSKALDVALRLPRPAGIKAPKGKEKEGSGAAAAGAGAPTAAKV